MHALLLILLSWMTVCCLSSVSVSSPYRHLFRFLSISYSHISSSRQLLACPNPSIAHLTHSTHSSYRHHKLVLPFPCRESPTSTIDVLTLYYGSAHSLHLFDRRSSSPLPGPRLPLATLPLLSPPPPSAPSSCPPPRAPSSPLQSPRPH